VLRPNLSAEIRSVNPPTRRLRAARTISCAVFFLAAAAAQQNQGAPALPAGYAGSEACQVCHEDIYKAFQKSPHELVETDKKRGWANRACESCHGPAAKHAESVSAEDIRQPAKLAAAEADRICLTCHQNQPTQVGRIDSSHAKNEVSCVACHTVHKNGPKGLVPHGYAAVNAQCAGCHSDVWASFQRPYRHRLPEGAMSCVDCHNPHGSVLPAQLQTTRANEPSCFNCHGDKAGPFVFDHAPVRLEGCQACHEPHGSANPRMLIRHEVRFVCLECHSNLPFAAPGGKAGLGAVPPAFHDLRSPRFNNCNVCHQKIHGSWVDPELLK
jgi:DmsE family decaheme c-type cytochrome